jgi:SAM-dependent methyltransferase
VPGADHDRIVERTGGAFRCTETGTIYPDRDGVPSLLAGIEGNGGDSITGKVKAFYEENPFPNYDGVQDYGDLVNRGQHNPFARGLLDAIGYNKLVLECGCGTGQLSHFLALNNNHVLGIDLSLSSLKLAVEHKLRNEVPRVAFTQMNIFDLGVKNNSFDVVISSGVLHHTKDARRAFAAIVRKAKPGGIIVVGLYNYLARVPTGIRARLIGLLGPEIDYVVRNRIRDRRKAEIWIKDQYYNPHETWHSIDEVMGWFRENDVAYLSCEPRIMGTRNGSKARNGSKERMFDATTPGSKARRVLTQLSWLGSISSEGALFVLIGQRAR